MKIAVLDAKTLGDDLDFSSLESLGEVISYETTDSSERLERVNDIDIVITNKVIISKEIMEKSPQLKFIAISATGMNNVDLDYAKERGIIVKNVAGYSTKSVVQHTFSMALYLLEKMDYYNGVVKSGEWSNSGLFTDVSRPFGEISNMRWGVIGLGAIGGEVATVARAFGADVCYYSTSGDNLNQPYQHLNLDELLSSCDIVSIHSPLNSKTQNLINSSNLSNLRDGAIILNLGRGGIINEADLAEELDRREIYGGLDVLEQEPILRDNPLLSVVNQDRLLITPHIAWTSREARVKLLDGVVENIREFING